MESEENKRTFIDQTDPGRVHAVLYVSRGGRKVERNRDCSCERARRDWDCTDVEKREKEKVGGGSWDEARRRRLPRSMGGTFSLYERGTNV